MADRRMKVDIDGTGVGWLAFVILMIAFYGEPDLVDAVVFKLTNVKGW